MTEPLPLLIETSVWIARDYLARSGELGDAAVASRFLVGSSELMVRRGGAASRAARPQGD
jgi:hypothetical protein